MPGFVLPKGGLSYSTTPIRREVTGTLGQQVLQGLNQPMPLYHPDAAQTYDKTPIVRHVYGQAAQQVLNSLNQPIGFLDLGRGPGSDPQGIADYVSDGIANSPAATGAGDYGVLHDPSTGNTVSKLDVRAFYTHFYNNLAKQTGI